VGRAKREYIYATEIKRRFRRETRLREAGAPSSNLGTPTSFFHLVYLFGLGATNVRYTECSWEFRRAATAVPARAAQGDWRPVAGSPSRDAIAPLNRPS